MKSIIYLFVFTCTFIAFTSISSSGQTSYLRMESIDGSVPIGIRYNLNDADSPKEGNPFLISEWREIKMKRRDGANYIITKGKYNIWEEALIVKLEDKSFYIKDVKKVEEFIIDGRTFIGTVYNDGIYGFFEILEENEGLYLLKKYFCYIQKGRGSNGISGSQPDKFYQTSKYYVKRVLENNQPLELKVGNRIKLKASGLEDFKDYLGDLPKIKYAESEIIEAFQNYNSK